MVNKKSSLIIAAIATLFCILSVAWFSCNKNATLQRCEGVICENGGYCSYDTATKVPQCVCPTGFEGASCATASRAKYLGAWYLRQIVIGSDTASYVGDTNIYVVFLDSTATPTTFFINNFANNPLYNQILCSIDSTNTYNFAIDTISAVSMVFNNYKLTFGYGSLSLKDTITGEFGVRHLTPTNNWVDDTVSIMLWPDKI